MLNVLGGVFWRWLSNLVVSVQPNPKTVAALARERDFGEDEDDWALPGDGRLVECCQECIAGVERGRQISTGCGCSRGSRECWQRMTYRAHVAGMVPSGAYRQGRCIVCGRATHWAGSQQGAHTEPWLYCSDACYERRIPTPDSADGTTTAGRGDLNSDG